MLELYLFICARRVAKGSRVATYAISIASRGTAFMGARCFLIFALAWPNAGSAKEPCASVVLERSRVWRSGQTDASSYLMIVGVPSQEGRAAPWASGTLLIQPTRYCMAFPKSWAP